MKIFEKPNTSGDWKCPICQQNTESPVTLIGIAGTGSGRYVEAKQVHVECLDLTWHNGWSAARAAITQIIY